MHHAYTGKDGSLADMKKQLSDELIIALKPFIPEDRIQDAAMMIDMVLNDYNVDQAERALIVYEEDMTQLMIRKFLAAKIAKGCSERTIGYYRDTVTKALMVIGKPYDQVAADDIRYYLAMRVQRDGVSKTTANNERRNLSAFYQWLQKEEILLKNPMNKIDPIKETKKKKKAFTQMEVEKIRDACITEREECTGRSHAVHMGESDRDICCANRRYWGSLHHGARQRRQRTGSVPDA